jgi:hypothetical protein
VGYSEGELEGGEKQPTATLQFQHLNKSLFYDFTFFASKANATDNRETQFILAGKDTLSVTIDASGNKAGTVTIYDMSPDKDGCITLTVQAGPNNDNPNKFYYLNALRISPHSTKDIVEWSETDYSDFVITHEFFTPSGIATSSSGGYDMTGYIPVKGGDVIVFSGDRSPGIPFMMGYTDNQGSGAMVLLGNFDATDHSNLNVMGKEIIIPAGISFVRCSARNTSLPNWAGRNMSVIKRSPYIDIALKGGEQPTIGDSLSLVFNGNLSRYTIKWTKGDVFGTFDDANVLSSKKNYVITENDYEHWLRVTVCDKTGNTVFTKDTWISKLPVLYIDTEDGSPITSKTDYVTASLRIQGNAEYEQQYLGETEIKGRGTTSWYRYPQKPYKLKLDKKTKLFGFGKSKHWVLIPNFNDKSCLRNYIASELAKELGVLSMDMTWVDVVLNGEVKGCYMLSQHVRVDKTCVDVFDWEEEAEDIADDLFNLVKDADVLAETDRELLKETMKQNLSWITDGIVVFNGKTYNLADYDLKKEYDISKGYLFEACNKQNGKTQFTTFGEVHFEVKTPEYLSTNNEMFSYVTRFWNEFEAEYSKMPAPCKNFSKYADMESMVGVWLVNEIMGQGDPTNSRYSYIADDGKLHFGPVWDFDHGASSWSASQATYVFFTIKHELDYIYYKKWFPDPFLCQMAYDAYWNVARPFVMNFISEGGEMDAKYALFAEAGRTNDILWGDYPSSLKPSATQRTTKEDVEILKGFLLGHILWLDERFLSVRTLVEAMNPYCTYPCDPDIIINRLQKLTSEKQLGVRKVIRDNHLYIIKNGNTYSVEGKRMK